MLLIVSAMGQAVALDTPTVRVIVQVLGLTQNLDGGYRL